MDKSAHSVVGTECKAYSGSLAVLTRLVEFTLAAYWNHVGLRGACVNGFAMNALGTQTADETISIKRGCFECVVGDA